MSDNIKIRMYGEHLCYVDRDLVIEFQNKFSIVNLNAWIKEECFKDYGLRLINSKSIREFKEMVEEDYYDNISDWLREKIRNRLLNRKEKQSGR